MNSKPSFFRVIVSFAVIGLVMPLATFAQEMPQKESVRVHAEDRERPAFSCDRLNKIEDTIDRRQANARTRFEAGRITRSDLTQKAQENKTALQEKRVEADARRAEMYRNLETKAETPEQKQVVTTFKETIEKLVTERHESIDAAHRDFMTGLETLRKDHQASLDDLAREYEGMLETIFNDARTTCATSPSPAILEDLKKELDAARDLLKVRSERSDKGEAFKALQETRRVAIEKAQATFQAGFDEAKKAVREAFATTTE